VSVALRIACFVPSFPELSETFILRQIAGLLERGHDVRVFTRRKVGQGPMHELVARHDLLARGRVLDDVGAVGDTTPYERHGRAAPGAFLRALRPRHALAAGGWGALVRTLRALRGEGPFDVVHCHYGPMGLRYGVAARLWNAPLVVSFYGYDTSRYPRERGDAVYGPLFAQASTVTSLSDHMDARLRALGCPQERIRRVPLSVEASDEVEPSGRVPRDDGTVRLLTVARLVEKKGHAHALRAIARMRDEMPGLHYDVIGDGPLRADLEALAATLGIADRVHFHFAATSDAVRRAMDDADLFVLPSVTASDGDEEGTPTVLLEAAYRRLPVLATRHAGISEVVADGESGMLVAEGDDAALAEGLRVMVRARERWRAMGEAGHRLVIDRGHLMGDVSARLEALYGELLAARAT
jgi:colanic acid/amylovoran biosynthesis glycosyltransferase